MNKDDLNNAVAAFLSKKTITVLQPVSITEQKERVKALNSKTYESVYEKKVTVLRNDAPLYMSEEDFVENDKIITKRNISLYGSDDEPDYDRPFGER